MGNDVFNTKIFFEDVDIASRYLKDINNLRNKVVLITGATGLIGKMLVYTLMKINEEQNANIKIIVTTRNIKKLLI